MLVDGQVKCEADKKAPILEKTTTDSIKDATKVAKIVMSEEEFSKMKKDLKEEMKKELMKDPDNGIKKYRLVFAEGKGVSWDFDKTFNAQYKIETVGAMRWARENL